VEMDGRAEGEWFNEYEYVLVVLFCLTTCLQA